MKTITRLVLILFVLSLLAGPVTPSAAGVTPPAPQVGDAADAPDVGQSPAAPTEWKTGSDLRFVANDYTNGDLDQYLFRTDVADGKLRYNIPITRFFFNNDDAAITFNSSGFLTSTALTRIRDKRLLPAYARLQMRVYDVDEAATWCPEVDTIEVNGMALYQGTTRARLSGANDTWSVVSFDVPISMLKFPQDKGNRAAPTPAQNEIAIRIDSRNCTTSDGYPAWAVEVDWGSLDFERSAANIIRPVLFAHGWTGNTDSFDAVENRLKEDGLPSAGQADLLEGLYPISETANLLQDYIYWGMVEYGVDKVNIFAHSKGGLVSRRAMEDYDAYAHTQNLLTWDTPNHGTYWADRTWSVEAACWYKYPFDATRRNRCISVAEEFRTDRVRNDFNYSGCVLLANGTWTGCTPKYVKSSRVNYYSFAAHGGLLTLVDVVSPSVSASYPWDAYAAGEVPMATSMHVDGDFGTDHGGILSDLSAYRCSIHLLDSSRYSCPSTLAANSVTETTETAPTSLLLNEAGSLNNETITQTLDVDGGTTLVFAAEADAALAFSLLDPSSRLINPTVAETDPNITYASTISGGLNIYEYVISNPPAGMWTAQVSSTGTANYVITALSNSATTLNLLVEQRTYHPAETVNIVASLASGGTPLTGGTYSGEVEFPTGTSQALTFNDGGINGDVTAGDGLFTAQFITPDEKGHMLVAVEAERNLVQRRASLTLPLSPQTGVISAVS
jgi:hypothetical protein